MSCQERALLLATKQSPASLGPPITSALRVQTQHMTSLQVFRAVLTTLRMPSKADGALAAHLATSPCAVLDLTGHVNFLASTPASVWQSLCQCASGTLAALSGPVAALGCPAAGVFAARSAPVTTFDAMLKVHLPGAAAGEMASDQPAQCVVAARAERLLTRALGDRAVSVCVYVPPHAPTLLDKGPLPGCCGARQLSVGLCLNAKQVHSDTSGSCLGVWNFIFALALLGQLACAPLWRAAPHAVCGFQANKIVDRGPPADSTKAAAAFRQLWGERAEMRRFPDGAIHEAVAWDHLAPELRSAIPDQIAIHILERHLTGAKVSCAPGACGRSRRTSCRRCPA